MLQESATNTQKKKLKKLKLGFLLFGTLENKQFQTN